KREPVRRCQGTRCAVAWPTGTRGKPRDCRSVTIACRCSGVIRICFRALSRVDDKRNGPPGTNFGFWIMGFIGFLSFTRGQPPSRSGGVPLDAVKGCRQAVAGFAPGLDLLACPLPPCARLAYREGLQYGRVYSHKQEMDHAAAGSLPPPSRRRLAVGCCPQCLGQYHRRPVEPGVVAARLLRPPAGQEGRPGG